MDKFISKRRLFLITLLILAAFCVCTVLGINISSTSAYAESEGEISYDYEYIPITKVEITAKDNATTIQPGETISLGVSLMPRFAEKTVKSIEYFICDGDEWVTVNNSASIINGNCLYVFENAIVGNTVLIMAVADEIPSQIYPFEIEKIPVESVSFTSIAVTATQGELYNLPISVQPLNCSFKTVSYTAIEGGEFFEYISESNQIKIKNFIGKGDAKIILSAAADGVNSDNLIEISIFVPVDTVSLTPDNISPFLGGQVRLSVGLGYATANEYGYTITRGEEFVESFNSDVLKIKSVITAQNPTITLYATCGSIDSESIEIKIQVPVTGISITTTNFNYNEGYSVVLPIPTISPNNASNKNYTCSVISGSEYLSGSIANGQFKIKDSMPISNAKIIIRVKSSADTDKYVDLNYNVIVPVKTLSIASNTPQLTSTSTNGTSIFLIPTFNLGLTAPTDTAITYFVSEGLSYVDSSVISSGNVLKTNSLKVKSGIELPNGAIKVYAIAEGKTSNTIAINVIVPVQTISLSTSYQRGTLITPTVNSSATFPNVIIDSYSVKKYGQGEVSYNNTTSTVYFKPSAKAEFFIPMNLVAGSSVTINYRATESGGIIKSCTFAVAPLSLNDFTLEYSKDYLSNQSTKNYRYSLTSNEVEAGYSIDVIPKYKEASLPDGLTASITYSSSYLSYNGLTLSASANANSGAQYYNVTVQDGNKSYSIPQKPLSIFRRLTGNPAISNSTIYNIETRLIKTIGSLNSNATGFSLENLKFVAEDGSNYKITEDGIFTVKSASIPSSIGIKFKFSQSYNGNIIDYPSGVITLKIKTVDLNKDGGTGGTDKTLAVNNLSGNIDVPTRQGYIFGGYFSYSNGGGTQYYNSSGERTSIQFTSSFSTLYAKWTAIKYKVAVYTYDGKEWNFVKNDTYSYNSSYTWVANAWEKAVFDGWFVDRGNGNEKLGSDFEIRVKNLTDQNDKEVKLFAQYTRDGCVANGTLITLADGTKKVVEDLDGSELLLVWNLYTGQYDSAPIIFIDSETTSTYNIINLQFSDGTTVKVITEHGFYDYNLNKYIFIREDNASNYLNHWFAKESIDENGNSVLKKVQLVNVVITEEENRAWSPVTFGHLSYFVNGMLSMPGATEGLLNIYEVNQSLMQFDKIQMNMDILKYGLFTYDEFADVLSYEMFEAFGVANLKVSIGKGLIDMNGLYALIERYSKFLIA